MRRVEEPDGLVREASADPGVRIPGGPFTPEAVVKRIPGGGSERLFYRVSEGRRSAVFLLQVEGGEELARYVETGDFLRSQGIPVPEFYDFRPDRGYLVMEDLGGIHLDEELERSDPDRELAFCRDATDMLFRLQTSVTGAMREEGFLEGRRFGAGELLGETAYFEREFVRGLARLETPPGWDEERRRLAGEIAGGPEVFMHRDFQSRNILVCGGELRVIDFQSAFRGPALYDTASFLKDPYHVLSRGTRKTLLMELYYRLSETPSFAGCDFRAFERRFVLAGIQRNMQALAAFAFLGTKMGKTRFLDSITPALDLLEEGLEESGAFPVILDLAKRLRPATEREGDRQ